MFTIEEIIQATKGKVISGRTSAKVRGVCIDSRIVKKGEAFIAVKGEIFDGHDFIANVIAQGVGVVIVHRPIEIKNPKVIVIRVNDTTRALGDIARFHRLRFKTPVIALTGSAGKTTTKEMIAAVLSRTYNVLKNEGTQNNHIGVPLTLLKLKMEHQIVVLECGTNQPEDIPWLADVARPDVVAFTNIGESHLEKLKTTAGVLKEKWALTSFLSSSGKIILNMDDPLLSKRLSLSQKVATAVTYGIKAKAQFRAQGIDFKKGYCLSFNVAGKTVELNSCGINNVYNALCAYACGLLFAVPVREIARALKEFQFPSGRGQILPLGRGWLINDVYNANPVSMRCALQTLDSLRVKGRKIFVAADMLELGAKANHLHRLVGQVIANSSVDILITVGQLSRLMASQAQRLNKNMQVFVCADVEEAQKYLAGLLHNGDAVLVKGSRRMKMEQVVDFLLASPEGFVP